MEKNQILLPELFPTKGIQYLTWKKKEKTNKKLMIDLVLKVWGSQSPQNSLFHLHGGCSRNSSAGCQGKLWDQWRLGLADIWGLEDAAPSFLGEPAGPVPN